MEQNKQKLGIFYTTLSYLIWGVLPLYWKLVSHVSAGEILAQRIIWSFVFMVIILTAVLKWPVFFRECRQLIHDPKNLFRITAASLVISLNWLTYIWAVNADHIIQASLGYYINPLVSVLLGIFVLKEQLTKRQGISVVLAAIGVFYLTFHFGVFPWISLILAFSFGIYGLLKKTINVSAMTGLTIETMIVLPLALIYLWFQPETSFTLSAFTKTDALLCFSGIATAIPLLLFASGARHIPLALVGFIQYIAPTIMLMLGVFLYHEAFSTAHAVAFAFIWAALVLYMSSIYRRPKSKRGMQR